jgi:hypothetical protein
MVGTHGQSATQLAGGELLFDLQMGTELAIGT